MLICTKLKTGLNLCLWFCSKLLSSFLVWFSNFAPIQRYFVLTWFAWFTYKKITSANVKNNERQNLWLLLFIHKPFTSL